MNYQEAIDAAVVALDAIDASIDPEMAHGEADAILLSLAPLEVQQAHQRLLKRAPWWAGA